MEQHIRFCKASDGTRLAYATTGNGPPLVKAANWLNHLEFDWDSPVWRHWWTELSRHHTLVRYDERGCGLSDWKVKNFSFDAWVEDLETVVDKLNLERFPLLGISQGASVAIAYAARHPERVSHLILHGAFAKGWKKFNLQQKVNEQMEALLMLLKIGWGQDNPAFRQIFTSLFIPDASTEQQRWFNDLERITTSPEIAARFFEEFGNIDVTDLLPQVSVPTLVLHARHDAIIAFEAGRTIATRIPDARIVSLESNNHILLEDEPAWPRFIDAVSTFLGNELQEKVSNMDSGSKAQSLDSEQWDQLSALFKHIVSLPPNKRQPALNELSNSPLRRELESLIAADAEVNTSFTEDFLGRLDAAIDSWYETSEIREGQMVSHFQILKKLGSGGMGVVYQGHDTRLDRLVALKFLPAPLSANEEVKRRFIQEAKAVSSLDDTNICTVYDIGETDHGQLFIAMACYEGETLKEKIARGSLPFEEAIDYAVQMAMGLARAHEAGIVHRDVKPANVMVTERGKVKLLDFGIAKIADMDLTQTGMKLGTPAYMSPEQARGLEIDHRSDLWSLGVVLYEMLAGERPFKGDYEQAIIYSLLNEEPAPLNSIRKDVNEVVSNLVQSVLIKEVEDRFENAVDFAHALERACM